MASQATPASAENRYMKVPDGHHISIAAFFLLCLLGLLAGAAPVHAQQPGRTLAADTLLTDFRPIGEVRLWAFAYFDSVVGTLASKVSEQTSINGQPAIAIEEELALDFAALRSDFKQTVRGQHFLSSAGTYLGDDLDVTLGETTEDFVLRRNGAQLSGYFTRGRERVDRSWKASPNLHAWDSYLIDQLEIILAMHEIHVGARITDSVIVPRAEVVSPLEAAVVAFEYRQMQHGVFDSVFAIDIARPLESRVYFSVHKRISRMEIPGQRVNVYLQRVLLPPRSSANAPQAGQAAQRINYPERIPQAALGLLGGVLALLLFIRPGYRQSDPYVGLIAGMIIFVAVPFTQMPVLRDLVPRIMMPAITEGESLLLWSTVPALAVALFQHIYILIAFLAVVFIRNPKLYLLPLIGGFCAAAYASADVVYGAFTTQTIWSLESWTTVERFFWVLFHTSAGMMLGWAFARGAKPTAVTLVIVVLLSASQRYLPVLVHQGLADAMILRFAHAFVVLATTCVALLAMRRPVPTRSHS